MSSLKDKVLEALSNVQDPDLGRDLVSLNMVKGVLTDGAGNVSVTIQLTTPACPLKDQIRADCEREIARVPGVGEIKVNITADVSRGAVPQGKVAVPGVKNIIAVGSGKGGVGKSTTAVNIAVALQRLGARVGLLDADIYGPNVPGMLGISGQPRVVENRIVPIEGQGLHVISMGFLVSDEQPIIWRGPMLHGALRQLLFDVAWGEQDYLVVDLPPGTGDVQLSLTQLVPITGAIVVTTPQTVALQDVRKGIGMFRQLGVPLLGVIENMSYYLCPNCGNRDEVFDYGGGQATAAELGETFLGEIPLNSQLRIAMDRGEPVAGDPDSDIGRIYREIAQRVAQQVAILNARQDDASLAISPHMSS